MPHLRIEFSANIAERIDAAKLLDAVCDALVGSGVFEPAAIKARVVKTDAFRLGSGDAQGFVHAGLALLSGRDADTKRRLTALLADAVASQVAPGALPVQVTAEARDMDRDTYSKRTL